MESFYKIKNLPYVTVNDLLGPTSNYKNLCLYYVSIHTKFVTRSDFRQKKISKKS